MTNTNSYLMVQQSAKCQRKFDNFRNNMKIVKKNLSKILSFLCMLISRQQLLCLVGSCSRSLYPTSRKFESHCTESEIHGTVSLNNCKSQMVGPLRITGHVKTLPGDGTQQYMHVKPSSAYNLTRSIVFTWCDPVFI